MKKFLLACYKKKSIPSGQDQSSYVLEFPILEFPKITSHKIEDIEGGYLPKKGERFTIISPPPERNRLYECLDIRTHFMSDGYDAVIHAIFITHSK